MLRNEMNGLMKLLVAAIVVSLASPAFVYAWGLVVEDVGRGSKAANAGLEPGDRIAAYAGRPLPSPAAFEAAQENTFGTKEVPLEVQRGGELLQLRLPVGPLEMQVRPELPSDIEALYQQAKRSRKASASAGVLAGWGSAARLATREGYREIAAWLYLLIGGELERQDQAGKASEAYLSGWKLIQNSEDSASKSHTLTALGRCSRISSDFNAARDRFERARQIDSIAGNEMWLAFDLNALGNVMFDRGDLQPAQDYYKQALSIRERLAPESQYVAYSLNNLGLVAFDRGDMGAAQSYYSRALAIEQQLTPLSLDTANTLNNLGLLADDRGDLQAAQGFHERALSIRQRLTAESLGVAASLNNLGNVALDRGDLAAAERYYRQSLAIQQRRAPNSLGVADTLGNLGLLAHERGDLITAEADFSRVLSIQERLAPDSLDVSLTLDSLGLVTKDRRDWRSAQEFLNRALRMQERLAPGSLACAQSLSSLAAIARERGDLPAAADYYRRSLKIRDRFAPNSLETAETLAGWGNVAFAANQLDDAALRLTRAVAIVESQRGLIASTDARALLVAQYTEPYAGLLRVQLARNDPAAAFLTSERARARSLLDLLTETRGGIRKGIDPNLLELERSLQRELNAKALHQTRLLSADYSPEQAASAARQIDELTVKYQDIENKIRTTSPHYAELTQPKPLTLAEVQEQVLDPESLLLEYALGEDGSYLFAVTRTSINSYALPGRAEIESLARLVYAALTARNERKTGESAAERCSRVAKADAAYPELAERLSQAILAPAATELGGKRLLIVGDGILLQIPFAALTDPSASGRQPLIAGHEVVRLPSASAMAVLRREASGRRPAPKQLAVFGDPVFERNDPRVKAAGRRLDVGVTRPPHLQLVGNASRAVEENSLGQRTTIARLLFSRQEANAIFSLATPGAGFRALGFDASKDMATSQELSKYRIVHFATHALLNNDHPELSGIVLSLIDRHGQDVDGFLHLNEIYNLDLPADLVVLSACQTGLGKEIKGEGMIGLVRGFMYAGAARVIGSLWKVDDAATEDLMTRFYQRLLGKRESVPEALREAQVEMSTQRRWRSPYFWAGFEMQGEWK